MEPAELGRAGGWRCWGLGRCRWVEGWGTGALQVGGAADAVRCWAVVGTCGCVEGQALGRVGEGQGLGRVGERDAAGWWTCVWHTPGLQLWYVCYLQAERGINPSRLSLMRCLQGVYPLSTNANGSYRDPEVIATINAHNALAAILNHASRLGPVAVEAAPPPAPVPTRNPLLDDTLTTGPPRPAESSQPSVLLLDPTDDAGDLD